MNKYFMAEKTGNDLQITIYGDITSWEYFESDVSSYTLSKLIQESNAESITVCINSYGGEVAEGLAIYNALKNSPAKVTTRCDGFACSAASVVFMAGDERLMNAASLLMIHNAWVSVEGNADELRKQADNLEIISKTIASTYLEKANISEEELADMLDAEAWITPEDAVTMGFATGIITETIGKQQYSAKKTIIRQLVEGKRNSKAQEKTPKPTPEPGVAPVQPEESGFQKLFDTFIKQTQ